MVPRTFAMRSMRRNGIAAFEFRGMAAAARSVVAEAAAKKSSRADTPAAQENVVEPATKKSGRAGLLFFTVTGAAVVGVLAYPQLVSAPPPQAPAITPPHPPPPPPPPAATAPPVVEPPLKPLSPREELTQRLTTLKAELAALRKQKRDKMVDMKKRSIKDEIRMIETGIAKLEKTK